MATIDKSPERIRQMFGQLASRYDWLNHLMSFNVDRYWRWKTVRLAPADGENPILDVCTGTGDLAFAYRKQTRGQVPIVASDFCPEMLSVAERKQSYLSFGEKVRFLEADTLRLPFVENSFQLVSIAFGLRSLSNIDDGLKEMIRVCQPGGRIVVLEFSTPTIEPLRSVYSFYFHRVMPALGRLTGSRCRDAYEYLPESVREFASGERLASVLNESGLMDVQFYPVSYGIATIYVGWKPSVLPDTKGGNPIKCR